MAEILESTPLNIIISEQIIDRVCSRHCMKHFTYVSSQYLIIISMLIDKELRLEGVK